MNEVFAMLDSNENNILHCASERGNLEIIDIILREKPKTDLFKSLNRDGKDVYFLCKGIREVSDKIELYLGYKPADIKRTTRSVMSRRSLGLFGTNIYSKSRKNSQNSDNGYIPKNSAVTMINNPMQYSNPNSVLNLLKKEQINQLSP